MAILHSSKIFDTYELFIMKIFATNVHVYRLIPPLDGKYEWGAKGQILTDEGKIETEEVLGTTKEDAETKAQKILNQKENAINVALHADKLLKNTKIK